MVNLSTLSMPYETSFIKIILINKGIHLYYLTVACLMTTLALREASTSLM